MNVWYHFYSLAIWFFYVGCKREWDIYNKGSIMFNEKVFLTESSVLKIVYGITFLLEWKAKEELQTAWHMRLGLSC